MNTAHALRVFAARLRLTVLSVTVAGFALGFTAAAPSATAASGAGLGPPAVANSTAAFEMASWTSAAARRIDETVLTLALRASRCATATGAVRNPGTLTIIDYSKASVEPRLWVLDLATHQVIYEELVSHGQGSGGNYATKFSNTPESHQTSIGLFRTDTTYVGRNGYSLRLDGLDHGFNDRARERAIVMHGAPYVDPGITKTLGRLGRSHGCPAVRAAVARDLIDRVKGGGLVFSYYPDRDWLAQSKYLGSCGAS